MYTIRSENKIRTAERHAFMAHALLMMMLMLIAVDVDVFEVM